MSPTIRAPAAGPCGFAASGDPAGLAGDASQKAKWPGMGQWKRRRSSDDCGPAISKNMANDDSAYFILPSLSNFEI
jgi:hypothetical protein